MTGDHPVSPERLTDHLPALRARLNQQRRFRVQQLAELEAEIDRAAVPTDAADAARYEVTKKLAAAARHALADIDETFTLITTGRYGRCRGCHTEIPIHLLQTIPATQWCLTCRRHLPAFDGSRTLSGQLPRTVSRGVRRDLSQRQTGRRQTRRSRQLQQRTAISGL
ncbi:TraR/DksA C4-type zinc finger protein [Nocardia amamiensis]|uniref:TraR/DksA C4-type zinc finger protein n=1 Tax=Nocardia amamiensis TaxID=404578 RepID=UPI000AD19E60|nr:TraR/DksA C4-type zinc finger protein [Nocardia amamiensis]